MLTCECGSEAPRHGVCPGCGRRRRDRRGYMKAFRDNPERKAKNRAYMRSYVQRPEQKEKRKEYEARPESKARRRDRRLQEKYGLSLPQRDAMVAAQGGLCAACGLPLEVGKEPVVDHCHRTGRVRGVVHGACNLALGHARDRPEILERLAAYLRKVPGVE